VTDIPKPPEPRPSRETTTESTGVGYPKLAGGETSTPESSMEKAVPTHDTRGEQPGYPALAEPGSGGAGERRGAEDLYAFGGRKDEGHPRPPRAADLEASSPSDTVGPHQPTAPTDTVPGASTYRSVEDGQREGLTGQVFRRPAEAPMPQGMGVHADGADAGGTAPEGHRTVYPTEAMSLSDFQNRYTGPEMGWQWHGTVNKKGEFTPATGRRSDEH
jgi:hypothetical protein